jgi:hypothetical protein
MEMGTSPALGTYSMLNRPGRNKNPAPSAERARA